MQVSNIEKQKIEVWDCSEEKFLKILGMLLECKTKVENMFYNKKKFVKSLREFLVP